MVPCFTSEEDFEKAVVGSVYGTKDDFMDKYRDHLVACELIASCAKSYILKHHKEIEDWSELDVKITDNSGETTHYFKFVPFGSEGSSHISDAFKKMDEWSKANQNPIKTIDDVVLDPSDGDLSLDVNGKPHLWIDDESCIVIADFIENKLK